MWNANNRARYDAYDDMMPSSPEADAGVKGYVVNCPQGGAIKRNQCVLITLEATGVRLDDPKNSRADRHASALFTTSYFQLKSWRINTEASIFSVFLNEGQQYTFKVDDPERLFKALTMQTERLRNEIRAQEFDNSLRLRQAPSSDGLHPGSPSPPGSPAMSSAQRIRLSTPPSSPMISPGRSDMTGLIDGDILDAMHTHRYAESPPDLPSECPLSPAQRIKTHRRSFGPKDLRVTSHANSSSPPRIDSRPQGQAVTRAEIAAKVNHCNKELAEIHRETLEFQSKITRADPTIIQKPHWEASLPQGQQEMLNELKCAATTKDAEIEQLMVQLRKLRTEQENPLLHINFQ